MVREAQRLPETIPSRGGVRRNLEEGMVPGEVRENPGQGDLRHQSSESGVLVG